MNICPTCRSIDFYEDDQGILCCSTCGLQLQDFVAESFEMEDETLVARYGGRLRGNSQRSTKKKEEVDKTDANISEFLKVFQYALRLLTRRCSEIAHLRDRQSFEVGVQELWTKYLRRWARSTVCIDEFFSGDRSTSDEIHELDCANDAKGELDRHPLFPSRPLMLGMIMLQFRRLRSVVIPADIVRWCDQGLLQYYNLWDHLPVAAKSNLSKRQQSVFKMPHMGRVACLTPCNLYFHCVHLARTFKMEVPPYNTAAVAMSMILALGFPKIVWEKFVKATMIQFITYGSRDFNTGVGVETKDIDSDEDDAEEVVINEEGSVPVKAGKQPTANVPTPELDTSTGSQYTEQIMAAIIVAVKTCPDWAGWKYVQEPSTVQKCLRQIMREGVVRGVFTPGTARNQLCQEAYRAQVLTGAEYGHLAMPTTVGNFYQIHRSDLHKYLCQVRSTTRVVRAKINLTPLNPYMRAFFASLPWHGTEKAEQDDLSAEETGYSSRGAGFGSDNSDSQMRILSKRSLSQQGPSSSRDNDGRAAPMHQQVRCYDLIRPWSQCHRLTHKLNPVTEAHCGRTAFDTKVMPAAAPSYLFYPIPKKFQDHMGVLHMPYVALLERCAKFLYIPPNVLHLQVQKVDEKLLDRVVQDIHLRNSARLKKQRAFRSGTYKTGIILLRQNRYNSEVERSNAFVAQRETMKRLYQIGQNDVVGEGENVRPFVHETRPGEKIPVPPGPAKKYVYPRRKYRSFSTAVRPVVASEHVSSEEEDEEEEEDADDNKHGDADADLKKESWVAENESEETNMHDNKRRMADHGPSSSSKRHASGERQSPNADPHLDMFDQPSYWQSPSPPRLRPDGEATDSDGDGGFESTYMSTAPTSSSASASVSASRSSLLGYLAGQYTDT